MLSVVSGFVLGAFLEPRWQDAVEPAQVLAGLVQYPVPTPTSVYSTSTWTLAHQIAAALLSAGFNEYAVSIFFSGVLGAVSFAALASVLDASGTRGQSMLAGVLAVYWAGATFPTAIMGAQTTYGVLGASQTLLVIGLSAGGRLRTAGVVAGLLLCVHPAWAALSLPVLLALGWWSPTSPFGTRQWRVGLGLGLLVSLASAVVHVLMVGVNALPGIAAFSGRDLAMISGWDVHRAPIELWSWEIARVVLLVGLVSVVWRRATDGALRHVALATLLVTATGLVLAPATWAPDAVPGLLTSLMPSRVFALAPLSTGVLALGLVMRVAGARWGSLLLVLLVAWPWTGLRGDDAAWWLAGLAAVATHPRCRGWLPATAMSRTVPVVLSVVATLLAVATLTEGPMVRAETVAVDAVLLQARRGSGLVLTADSIHLVQLRTRRPVLLDGAALDGYPYAPASFALAHPILEAVYGIDVMTMRPDVPEGRLTGPHVEAVWTSRTQAEWQVLAAQFHFVAIVTPSDWTLQLPPEVFSRDLALWRIPGVPQ